MLGLSQNSEENRETEDYVKFQKKFKHDRHSLSTQEIKYTHIKKTANVSKDSYHRN